MGSALREIVATEWGKYIVFTVLQSPYGWLGLLLVLGITGWLLIQLPDNWLFNALLYLWAGCGAVFAYVGLIYAVG